MTNATQAFSYRSRAAALPSSTLEAHRRVSRVPEPRDAGIEQCAPDAATAVRRPHRHAELGDVLGHEPVAGLRCRDDASPRGTARLALVGLRHHAKVRRALPAVKVVRISRVRADLLKGHARLPVPVERLDQESFEQVTVLRRRGAQLHDSDSAGSGGSSRA